MPNQKPAPQPSTAFRLYRSVCASHDADCLNDLRAEVNALTKRAGHVIAGDAEPCDAMPTIIQAAVQAIHDRYPAVFPMATSLYAASISMEIHARLLRDQAFGILPPAEHRIMGVLDEIGAERIRQNEQHGTENIPSVIDAFQSFVPSARTAMICGHYGLPSPAIARANCENAFDDEFGTWAHILVEEVAEAVGAPDEAAMRRELVQVAAVAGAWIEDIDRRTAAAAEAQV